MDIVLASQSPRRRELLERMGLTFRVVVPDVEERMDRGLGPDELVKAISAEKAAAAAELVGREALVIAADTVVALDGAILGKPSSPAHARQMLRSLSGRRHMVYTGVTVRQGDRTRTLSQATAVSFRSLDAGEIDAYIATGEPLDKAGAYGIQGYGAMLVEGIQGDYYNVVGLPVCALGETLKEFGLEPLRR